MQSECRCSCARRKSQQANVRLKVSWTFSTGSDRGEEAAPIVVNNTMYIVTPFPNTLYALDLTQPGAPAKWSYKPKDMNNSAKGVACCDWVNR
jgi:lanthanide-dependent methanol dehydrogenase